MKKLTFTILLLCFALVLQAQVSKTVVCTAGALSTLLTTTEKNTVTDLTITGTIDARDFKMMRDEMPFLENIDLSGVTVVAYSGIDGTLSSFVSYPANLLPYSAFYNSSTNEGKISLKSALLPLTVKILGSQCFKLCTNLDSVNIPSSVDSIQQESFFNCRKLTSVTVPSGVSSIGSSTFYNCVSLSHLPIHEGINIIGYAAFANCTGLTEIIIPKEVTTICDYAFVGCLSTDSITIPSTVTSIWEAAFQRCSGVITVDEGNPNFSSSDGILFDKPSKTLIQCPTSKTGSYSIPSTVTTIGKYAFYDCSNLSAITIPSAVSLIKYDAFYQCSGLDTIITNPIFPVDLTLSYEVFDGVHTNACKLFVPFGSKSDYEAADKWKDFHNILEMNGFILSKTLAHVEVAENSTDSVIISSNTAWAASSDQIWLTVNPETGTGNDTLIFTAEENTSASPRTATVTVSATGVDSQTITVKQEGTVPSEFAVADTTVSDTESTCFNAHDTITVAGGGTTVEFLSGSTVNLIAGQSIRFLPGFYAYSGSYVEASITTTSTFCDGVSGTVAVIPEEKSVKEEPLPEKQAFIPEVKSVKVYPNPNNGQFTLELSNVESGATIGIYNILGERVYQSTATKLTNTKINLSCIRKGIYFVKVVDGKEQFRRKMVVN